MKRSRASFIVTDPDGAERQLDLVGRFAQTLEALIDAGPRGMTTQDIGSWAVRTSHYISKLRGEWVLDIETAIEKHGVDFPGNHGRYVLRSKVRRTVNPKSMQEKTGRAAA